MQSLFVFIETVASILQYSYRFAKYDYLLLLVVVVSLFYNCSQSDKDQFTYQIKKQWSGVGPDFGTGDISPDGTYFTDINWSSGDLKIINVETNETRDLTGQGYDEGGYAWMSSFSNSGNQIAYEWYNYETGTHDLKLFLLNSSEVRTLIPSNDSILYWEPLDWTKNDEYILVAKQFVESNWEIGLVSTDNGQYKQIVQLSWNAPGGIHPFAYPNADLSPDDKYVGFDYRMEASTSNDLFLVSVEDGQLTTLLEGNGDDKFLSWSKDGKEVLFYSDRSGEPAIWKLRIKNGEAVGNPIMVLENIRGITPIGDSKKGFAYGTRTGDFNTYIAEVDSLTGEILKSPVAVNSDCYCRNNVGDWSNDGKSLLYIRFYDLPTSRESVVIKSLEDDKEIEYFFPWDFHNKTGTVAWISDNVVLVDGNSPGYSGIHKFDLSNKTLNVPANYGEVGFFQRFKANSDGTKLFVERRWEDPGVMSFDTYSGEASEILKGNVIPTSTSIAPNDNEMAYLRDNVDIGTTTLEVINLSTMTIKTIITDKLRKLRPPVVWMENGKQLVTGVALSPEKKGLWSVELEDPHNRFFIDLPEVFGRAALRINAAGGHFAFQMGKGTGDLFFIEGF
jgi:Tol biopolymer transport system component